MRCINSFLKLGFRFGNTRKARAGFTLIEMLVTVAVLSLGLVMLYEAFFSCLDAFGYASRRLYAQRWIDEKVWQVQDELMRTGSLLASEPSGSFRDKGKSFYWTMMIDPVDHIAGASLYKLILTVGWQQTRRDVSLIQVAYVDK